MLVVIHYGSDKYSSTKFKPIRNRQFFNKPTGGLWTSPINSDHSWKDWCVGNDFNLHKLNKSFTLLINKGARILTINDVSDLYKLPKRTNLNNVAIPYTHNFYDFQKIAQEYDIIHLTGEGERNTRFSMIDSLYGWDCETVLIMNTKCFITI